MKLFKIIFIIYLNKSCSNPSGPSGIVGQNLLAKKRPMQSCGLLNSLVDEMYAALD